MYDLSVPGSVSGDNTLQRAQRLRRKRSASIHMISVPTPVLLHGDEPVSPNRTNYFPTPQLMLASSVLDRLEAEGIPWTVHFDDFKSIPDMEHWDAYLQPYAEFQYGHKKLTKAYVGDGMQRLPHALWDADVVCITANFTLEAYPVVQAIATLRRLDPNKLILVGGRDAMARPDYFLRMGADLVAYGDADYSLPELLVRLYRDEDLDDLVKSRCLVQTGERIQMDGLPFMRFEFLKNPLTHYCESGGGQFLPSILKKGGVAYFESSRGCFRECGYCTERLTKRSEMSVQRFKDEVAWYRANGVSTVMLSDDNLLQRLNHGERGELELIEMFEYLKKMEMVWEFPVGIEIGRLMQKDSSDFREHLFDLMFWNSDDPDNFSGAFRGLVPFENILADGDAPETNLRKMRTVNENMQILSRVIAAGMPQINLAVMLGFPDATKEKLKATRKNLETIMEIRDDITDESDRLIGSHINFSLFNATPYPGTPYFDEVIREKRLEYGIEEHPELWNLYTSVVRGDTFTAAENTENRHELLQLTRSHHSSGKVKLHFGSGDEARPTTRKSKNNMVPPGAQPDARDSYVGSGFRGDSFDVV